MNLETLRSLQARIRNATGPDRGLDRAIADALLGKSHPINRRTLPPTYTGSLDACVGLQEAVLPGCTWSRSAYGDVGIWAPRGGRSLKKHEQSVIGAADPLATDCNTFLDAIFAAVIAREEAMETEKVAPVE